MRYVATIFFTISFMSIVYVIISTIQVGSTNDVVNGLQDDIDAIDKTMADNVLTSIQQLDLLEIVQKKLRLILIENEKHENSSNENDKTNIVDEK